MKIGEKVNLRNVEMLLKNPRDTCLHIIGIVLNIIQNLIIQLNYIKYIITIILVRNFKEILTTNRYALTTNKLQPLIFRSKMSNNQKVIQIW